MHLKRLDQGPPGNWQFVQQESKYHMAAVTFDSLLGKVLAHRKNMNYPLVSEGYNTLSDEVQDYICWSLNPVDQVANCQMGFTTVTSVNWQVVAKFLRTMGSWFMSHGFSPAPQEEADRRALICSTCPLNVGLSGCGPCALTLQGIRAALLKRSTPYDAQLSACGICGCDNALSVHVPLEALKAGDTSAGIYPEWCWKTTQGTTSPNTSTL